MYRKSYPHYSQYPHKILNFARAKDLKKSCSLCPFCLRNVCVINTSAGERGFGNLLKPRSPHINLGSSKMAGFSVYQDSYIGATIISNRFIDEYMNEANDAQLKVYLYLVRMLNANLETSVQDIADRFNHTEKDVIRAFVYWEKKGLLTLDYNEQNELTGVHLVNLCRSEAKGPSVESTHNKLSRTESKEEENIGAAGFVAEEPYEEEIPIPEKRKYDSSEITAIGEKGGMQLAFLAETYFGKTLTPSDLQTLFYISDGLGFSDDLTDYLLQYCAEKGKKDFRYAEKVAIGWRKNGIVSVEQARGNNLRYDRTVYDIMNRLGKKSTPTDAELEYIVRWRKDYGFSEEVIFRACDKAVLTTDAGRFNYAEGILKSWHEQNAHSIEEIEELERSFKKKSQGGNVSGGVGASTRNNAGGQNSGTKKNLAGAFGNFKQNEINFEELKKRAVVN